MMLDGKHQMKYFQILPFALCLICNAQDAHPTEELSRIMPPVASADAGRSAVQQQSVEYVIPEVIFGGEWTTTIKLANRGTQSIPRTGVYFLDNLGRPMKATFQITNGAVLTDTAFSFSLPPGTIVEGTFVGGADTQFGQAFIDLCSVPGGGCYAGLYGEVTLRNKNATRPDFESVFPLEQPAPLQYMLWDHRNGVTTVLYLVNENLTSTTVTLDFLDTSNALIGTSNVTLPAQGSNILTLHVLVPQTVGLQGTLVLRAQNSASLALVVATALRINPSNSFTPMRAFIPSR